MTRGDLVSGVAIVLAHMTLSLWALHSGSESGWLALGLILATVAALAGMWHLMHVRPERRWREWLSDC